MPSCLQRKQNQARAKANSSEFDDMVQDFGKRLRRRAVGFDLMDNPFSIKIQHRLSFLLVGFESGAECLAATAID
jgi:hypothetical protein